MSGLVDDIEHHVAMLEIQVDTYRASTETPPDRVFPPVFQCPSRGRWSEVAGGEEGRDEMAAGEVRSREQ